MAEKRNSPKVQPARIVKEIVAPEIPPSLALRNDLLRAAREFVTARRVAPPLSFPELRELTREFLSESEISPKYGDFASVIVSNEVWRGTLGAIPYSRRLLLLPQCLRDETHCPAKIDEYGLLCRRCGRCRIAEFQTEAEALGYVCLVAEGTSAVMSLIESGQIEAVVGVSCMAMLEKLFPYMEAGAVPGIAIPLLCDGCSETTIDNDWLWDAIYLSRDGRGGRMNLDALRDQIDSWFTPESLSETLGSATTETQRIAHEWLQRGGKRWRPFLAACAQQAVCDEAISLDTTLRPIAVSIECFHKASLIHDDIEDEDETRYDQPALHMQHGIAVALNVGDLLIGEGYRLLGTCDLDASIRAELSRVAADGHHTLCLGQGEELCWMRHPKPLTLEEVLDIFRWKTAPAFEVALRLGTLLGKDPSQYEATLVEYSEALGVAYQIRDDLDDFFGDGGDDLLSTRPTVVLALLHRAVDDKQRPLVEAIWRRETPTTEQAEHLRKLAVALGIERQALQLIERFKQRALAALRPLENANLKALLRRVLGKIFCDFETMGCCNDNETPHAPTSDAR